MSACVQFSLLTVDISNMSTLPYLLLLLTLAVTSHAQWAIKVTPNCFERKNPQTCAKMTVTITFLHPLKSEPWTSDTLLLDFQRRIGDESCNFYISVKDEPVSFLSECTNDHGVNKYDGAFFRCGFNVNYNDKTLQHEYGSYGLNGDTHRSISAEESESFCRTIDPSLLPDDEEDQVPHVKRQQTTLNKDAVIEIAFAADNTFLEHYESPAKAEKVIYQIKNGMRAMFQQLDIGIEAVDVFIFDEKLTSDLIRAANKNAELEALNKSESKPADRFDRSFHYWRGIKEQYSGNFIDRGAEGAGRKERARLSGAPDAVITFTTRPFDSFQDDHDVTLGFAPAGHLCKKKGHAFILMPKWYDDPDSNSVLLANLVVTVSHELGHLLDLDHQDNCSTGCVDDQKCSCIMHSISSRNSGNWSKCSTTQIRGVLQNPYLSPTRSKECLYTKDAYSRNVPLYVPVGSPDTKIKRPTRTVASSREQSPLYVPLCPSVGKTITETSVTIDARTPDISNMAWIIIAVCVLVAVIVIAVAYMLCKKKGPLVSRSSPMLHHKSHEKTPKIR